MYLFKLQNVFVQIFISSISSEERSSEKKEKMQVVERLVDMLGKNRKRRSSEDQNQDLSSLPRKQPFAHVDLDF